MAESIKLPILLLPHGEDLEIPKYATEHSAGLDLRAAIDDQLILEPGEFKLIPTGIAIELPERYEAQIRPRSGLAAKFGITVLNSPGTIDSDYRGEIKVCLINYSKSAFVIKRGDRIAQMVMAQFIRCDLNQVSKLTETIRSDGGFGSTGSQ